jgi:hypothetical protein
MLHIYVGSGSSTGFEASSNLRASSGLRVSLDVRWTGLEAPKRLDCDASIVVVNEDEVGNVLNISRRSWIIPVPMSRALSIRDGGRCQFPECCESRYVEGHHIVHWVHGGETKLYDLVKLCWFHHRELHRGKFFLSLFAERLCFSWVGTDSNGHVYKGG